MGQIEKKYSFAYVISFLGSVWCIPAPSEQTKLRAIGGNVLFCAVGVYIDVQLLQQINGNHKVLPCADRTDLSGGNTNLFDFDSAGVS